jgi:hypothetical protein
MHKHSAVAVNCETGGTGQGIFLLPRVIAEPAPYWLLDAIIRILKFDRNDLLETVIGPGQGIMKLERLSLCGNTSRKVCLARRVRCWANAGFGEDGDPGEHEMNFHCSSQFSVVTCQR